MDSPISSGIFSSSKNILQGKWGNISRLVPYFNITKNTTNQIIYKTMEHLNKLPMDFMDTSK